MKQNVTVDGQRGPDDALRDVHTMSRTMRIRGRKNIMSSRMIHLVIILIKSTSRMRQAQISQFIGRLVKSLAD